MELYDVNPDYWISNLLPLLDPVSLRFQERMAADLKNKFEEVEKALIQLHGMTPSHYRSKWYCLEKGPHESFRQVLQRASIIFHAWTKGVADITDMMLKEEIIAMLPPQARAWVTTLNTSSAVDTATRADEFIENQPKPPEMQKKGPYTSRPERMWTSGQKTQGKREMSPNPKPKPDQTRPPSFDPVKGPRCY